MSSPTPLLLLTSRRSRSTWSFYIGTTLFDTATWMVTETIYIISRRSFTTPFLTVETPSLPPTMLAVSWSIEVVCSTARRRTLATCPGRAKCWRLRFSDVAELVHHN